MLKHKGRNRAPAGGFGVDTSSVTHERCGAAVRHRGVQDSLTLCAGLAFKRLVHCGEPRSMSVRFHSAHPCATHLTTPRIH